ncbi:MAG: choloylglycine hydrolase family protein [Flavobacteriales bacterium]|nr:choloylglycine hydrolase family protein [Flavobacteriales bacterium]
MRVLKITLLTILLSSNQIVNACTGIIIKTQNGVTIPARTMEFGFDVRSKLLVIPKGTSLTFLSSMDDKEGFKMKTKYGFAGMNAVEKQIVVDGVNEAGLYLGCFYFPGFASYEKLTPENQSKAISSEEMGNYVLGNFATVEEVIEGLRNITVVGSFITDIQGEAPFHYAITDATGRSIVVEYSQNGLEIFENSVRAVCNSPSYDWHLTNLRNFVNLTPNNRHGVTLNGDRFTGLGEGTGMLGLPGDYTSSSRFVRAAAFANTALPSKNEEEGVFRAFHTLNAFDIPKGAIREKTENQMFTDYTVWTSAVDTKNKIYYYKTYKNQAVRQLNLLEILEATKGKVTLIESETERRYEKVSLN